MFQNYIKTTFRHLSKSKVNFSFKLGGLTLALFSFLVIALFVCYQFSFDRFHEDYKSIYRVNSMRDEDGKQVAYAAAPAALGPALKNAFPKIKSFACIGLGGRSLIRYNDKFLRSETVASDSNIFNVFTFKFIKGDRRGLTRPASIILTESLARKIFGDEDPINKSLVFAERLATTLYVTGVIQDLPSNSHLDFEAITSSDALKDKGDTENNPLNDTYLYIRLEKGQSFEHFSELTQSILKENLPKKEDESENKFSLFLQPLDAIHLAPSLKLEFTTKGNALYIYIFSLLGFFLLFIAGINYVNLSVADYNGRMKELGMRKILGARKRHIIYQLGWEAFLYCTVALTLSFGLIYVLFPNIQHFMEPNLRLSMLLNPGVIGTSVITLFLLIALSVLYPSLILHKNSAIDSLKGSIINTKDSIGGSKLLLIQFVVSIICICATLIVSKQMAFIKNADLGYNRHNIVALLMPDRYPFEKAPTLKSSIQKLAGVESATFSYYSIAGSPYWKGWYKVETENGEMRKMLLPTSFVDQEFLTTMQIPLLQGRNFNSQNIADVRGAFIVNETAAKAFGWNDNPIGKRISIVEDKPEDNWQGTVVGVVKDFNVRPLHERIEPLILRLQWDYWPGYWLNVRINGPVKETIARVKSSYESVLPGFLIDYRMVEDVYDKQYENENRAYRALQVSTLIILMISCFGVFSLSIFLSYKRMKEFGIRKVLGSTVVEIITLHLKYFLKVMVTANLIALPISYLLVSEWLDGFAYKTSINGILFISISGGSMFFVILSAGYAAWRAANVNPIKSIQAD